MQPVPNLIKLKTPLHRSWVHMRKPQGTNHRALLVKTKECIPGPGWAHTSFFPATALARGSDKPRISSFPPASKLRERPREGCSLRAFLQIHGDLPASPLWRIRVNLPPQILALPSGGDQDVFVTWPVR